MSSSNKSDLRRTHKPIMEKRRRARINHSLNEIKSLILEAMNKDPARHSKLEKADILEMAVKHLQQIQRQQLAIAMATDPQVIRKFRSGFADCTAEIDRYINRLDGGGSTSRIGLKSRLLTHLQKCSTNMEPSTIATSPPKLFPQVTSTTNQNPPISTPIGAEDQNNNDAIGSGGGTLSLTTNPLPSAGSIQVIPSRLSSGEIALILPKTNNEPFLTSISRGKLSAFATVLKSNYLAPPVPILVKSETETCHSGDYDDEKYSNKAEALTVITNQSERYRQAQVLPDSSSFVENRKLHDKEIFPIFYSGTHSAFKRRKIDSADDDVRIDVRDEPSSSSQHRADDNDSNNDMWRPW